MTTKEKILAGLVLLSALVIAGCVLSLFVEILMNVFGGVSYEVN